MRSKPIVHGSGRQRRRRPPRTTALPRNPRRHSEAAPVAPMEPAGETIGAAEPADQRVRPAIWPDFRGPARDGRSAEVIRTDWPAGGLPLLWKQPIGLGYSSFVVAGRRAFTIEQRRREEVVAAYNVETGRELWTNVWEGEFVESMGGDGPRATPTYHDGRVYALGALGELRSLDAATGKVIWRRNILEDNRASNLEWGMSAAPLVVDDKLILLPGGSGGRSVVAYDRGTGEPIWRALDDRQAYCSPMLVTLAGVRTSVDRQRGACRWPRPGVRDAPAGSSHGRPARGSTSRNRCSLGTTASSCRRATARAPRCSSCAATANASRRA